MSPVSRGRKRKGKNSGRRSDGPPPARRRAAWFGPAIAEVLADAQDLVHAGTVRELEQATARLLGKQLNDAIQRVSKGLWFGDWFEALVEVVQRRVVAEVRQPGGEWEASWRLLHGLAAIASPAHLAMVRAALRRTSQQLLSAGEAARQPEWLPKSGEVAATGEVFRMTDVYGTRFAVLAEVRYPDEPDPAVFVFDVDASGIIRLAGAGVFDNLDDAAAAWRGWLGDTAGDAHPRPVRDSEELLCLLHCGIGDWPIMGDEPRAVLDHWYLAARRLWDVARALRDRGLPLPAFTSLYKGIDVRVMTNEFVGWYRDRHGTEPDLEAVEALAEEWMEGALPETWFAISPERLRTQRALIGDWLPGDVTTATLRLLPEWARWLGERADLPQHLVDRAISAVAAPV